MNQLSLVRGSMGAPWLTFRMEANGSSPRRVEALCEPSSRVEVESVEGEPVPLKPGAAWDATVKLVARNT